MLHARPDYQNIQDVNTPIERDPIPLDEPVFLLRAQDQHAAATLRFWAHLVGGTEGMRNPTARMAMEHADRMDSWPKKKQPDAPACEDRLDEELLDYSRIIKNTLCTQKGVKFMGKEAPEGLYIFEIVSNPVPFEAHYAEAMAEMVDTVLEYCNEMKDHGADEVTVFMWNGWPFNPMHGHRQISVHAGIMGRTRDGNYLAVSLNGGDIAPFQVQESLVDADRAEIIARTPPQNEPRSLKAVLESILVLVPELQPKFEWLLNHIAYQPPEAMGPCWIMAAEILDAHLPDIHPRHDEVIRILQGHDQGPASPVTPPRFRVTVEDVNPPEGTKRQDPITFEGEHLDCVQERGVSILTGPGGRAADINPNGQERITVRLWTGCESFDSFQERT